MGKTKMWTILLSTIGIIFILIGINRSGFTASKLLTIGVSTVVSSVTTYFTLRYHVNKSKL